MKPPKKPYVICHMVSSIDGRIWGSRWRPKANIVPNLFEKLHDQMGGGSWLCGRVTAQEFAKGKGLVYPPTDQKFPRENWYATRDAKARGGFRYRERRGHAKSFIFRGNAIRAAGHSPNQGALATRNSVKIKVKTMVSRSIGQAIDAHLAIFRRPPGCQLGKDASGSK